MKKITLLIILLITGHYVKAQDTCATAISITPGLYVVGTINGTQVPLPLCDTQYGAVPADRPPGGEWYVYTPTENHSVTVTTDLVQNTPLIDTRFHVYKGSCDALICHEGDDDSGGGLSSTATFDVIANTTYYIAFDNRWTSVGFTFQLTENVFVPNPCSSATPVNAGVTTVNSLDEDTINTPCSSGTMAKWYVYTPTISANVTISSDLVQNTCMNTTFNVYTGACTALTCFVSDDDSGIITCDSDNTSLLSKRTFAVSAGQTYFIAWSNQYSDAGFDFEITETPIVVPIEYTIQNVPTIASNYNICVVDMNNDNIDDMVGVSANNLKIHYQQPGGGFTVSDFTISGTSFMPSWSMAAGDYNRDGYNDLVLGAGSGLSIWTAQEEGTGYTAYTPGEYIFCQRTNFADLNQDGNLDVFSCHDIAPNVYYLNDGNGNLTHYQVAVTPGAMNLGDNGGNYSTLFTDFDNDGDTDVFISKCSGPPCELHRNDGDGVYTNISALAQINVTPIQTWSSGIADFDNDGDMDIIITSSGSAHKFFRNNLDTSNSVEEAFTNITAGSGWDTNLSTNIDNVAYDFDNDGRVDVLGGGGKIMFNQGNNTFAPTEYPAIPGVSSAISIGAIGDLNNDGFLDIQNGTNIRFAIPNGNNWFKVLLQGTQSNTNGIGARIEIYGDFGIQIRDIRSGEGFRYMSSLNAHFGLGQSTAITQLIIKWPSGIVDTIANPEINAALRVTEGSTLAVNGNTNSVFTIYPNPAKQVISISIDANSTEKLKDAQIFDLSGRMILETKLTSSQINIGTLKTGTYLLLLTNEQGKGFTQKFIKE